MVTLLASLLGFAGSLLPNLIKLWTDKKDKEHELALTKLQMEREDKGHQYKLEEIQAESEGRVDEQFAEVSEKGTEFHALDEVDTKNPFVIAANIFMYIVQSIVRPGVAIGFFGLYSWVKVEMYMVTKSVLAIWTAEDMALFAAIMAYYYSDRSLSKYFRKGK